MYSFTSAINPCDFHSFPTRRSSDLSQWPAPNLATFADRYEENPNVVDTEDYLEESIIHGRPGTPIDRKSTRLNSSHVAISYAVFCLKKKIHTHQPVYISHSRSLNLS